MFDTRSSLVGLIEGLERDIKDNPDRRQADLAALRAALAAIDRAVSPPVAAARNEDMPAKLREGSKKEYFRSVVSQMLETAPAGRIHRKAVIDQVGAMGMFGTTKDLDRDVSKYLSTDGTFAPDGDGYWKRKPPQAEDASPRETATREDRRH